MTDDPGYAQRLQRLESSWWKRTLDVQRPYRRNLQSLDPGFTLDVGCGLGRNLAHLDGYAVGVDHNEDSVAIARDRGFRAYTPNEFAGSEYARPELFDALLASHVVEHMTRAAAVELLRPYLEYVRRGGKVIVITPQARGFRSDPTHVELFDDAALDDLVARLGLEKLETRSFPFPRAAGRIFTYNELVTVARRPA